MGRGRGTGTTTGRGAPALRRRLRALLVVVVLAAAPGAGSVEITSCRAAGGDGSERALPEYDDSSWQTVQLPASLQRQGVRPAGGFAWYRCRFQLPEGASLQGWAVQLGPVYDAAELYLNGAAIGSQGSVPERWHDYAMGFRYQAVALPADILDPGVENLLAVRVFSLHGDSGMAAAPLILGPRSAMIEQAERANHPYLITVLLSLAVLLVSTALTLGIALSRRQLLEHLWLVVFLVGLTAVYWLEHLHLLDPDLKTPLAERLANLCIAVVPVALMLHLDTRYGLRTTVWQWVLAGSTVAWGLLLLVWDLSLATLVRYAVHGVWLVPVVAAAALVRAVRGAGSSWRESWPVLAALAVGFAGLMVWISGHSFFLAGVSSVDLGILGLVLLLLLDFGLRTGRERRQLEEYAGGMLRAQEAERHRLARDLHDGLAQRLAVTRLRLDGVASDELAAACRTAVGELEQSIDELRDIVADLRPIHLDQAPLGAAIHGMAQRYAAVTDHRIASDIDATAEAPDSAKIHLLRIAQEALQNAVRHAAAESIRVAFHLRGDRLVLEVRDDGQGFHTGRARGRGLGLIALEERARLCGGAAEVQSVRGGGTMVRVTVPSQ